CPSGIEDLWVVWPCYYCSQDFPGIQVAGPRCWGAVRRGVMRAASLDAPGCPAYTDAMKRFSDLYALLDETTKTSVKVEALRSYFATAPAADAAWAVYFLIGRKPRQVVATGRMRAWAAEEAGVEDWLFQESYDAVGDIAETIALLLPPPEHSS